MRRGKLLLVEDKAALMDKLGRRQIVFTLAAAVSSLPPHLAALPAVTLSADGLQVIYGYGATDASADIDAVLSALAADGLSVAAIDSKASSLEDIFVELIREPS